MISTIQLSEEVKNRLLVFKEKQKQSFEEIIVNLIDSSIDAKKKEEELLAEEYKELAEESLKITKEFEAIDEDFDWEWKK